MKISVETQAQDYGSDIYADRDYVYLRLPGLGSWLELYCAGERAEARVTGCTTLSTITDVYHDARPLPKGSKIIIEA